MILGNDDVTHPANDDEVVPLTLTLHKQVLSQLVELTVQQTLQELDWPANRLALTEEEAAKSCGVGRHVLRDQRQRGQITCRRIGKKIVYRRQDLFDFLHDQRLDQNGDRS